jgi:hypothetical protein
MWEFLWREVGPNGQLKRRTTAIGNIEQYPTQQEASEAINGLRVSINEACNRQPHKSVLMGELVDHYIEKELGERFRMVFSSYENYLPEFSAGMDPAALGTT